MTRFLSSAIACVTLAAILTACQAVTSPARDPRCIYAGDTIGVIKKVRDGTIEECVWLRSDVTTCFKDPVQHTARRCVVGEPSARERSDG